MAALTVVFSHYFPFWKQYLGDVNVLIPNELGSYAVHLFFIISGFVIFVTLEKCRNVKDFVLLRFSRLYPTYWTTLVIATAIGVAFFGKTLWLRGFAANTTMFQEFMGIPNFDNVYWSLTVELAFYLNVAWVFKLGLHRRIVPILAAWLCLSGIWAVTVMDPTRSSRDWLSLIFAFDFAPLFTIGILFYKAINRPLSKSEVSLYFLAVFVRFLVSSWTGAIVAIVSTILVYLALAGHLRLITGRFTLWLGSISYALYLVHHNIGYDMLPVLHKIGLNPYIAIGLLTIGILVLATIVSYTIEIPASRKIRRLWLDAGR